MSNNYFEIVNSGFILCSVSGTNKTIYLYETVVDVLIVIKTV